jgi:uncharacterized RDD family membrane protein YckC
MMNSNDILRIDTPENVTFDYDVAGIGSRFLAALADTALIILLQVILFGAVLLVVNIILGKSVFENSIRSWVFAISGILSFVFLWGYYIFFEILWNGQSPGKRWVGLRVIRMDGTPITASEAVIRNLVRIIDFLPTAYGVGVVTMFINADSRRVGDLAAGTIVVHDREDKSLDKLSPVKPAMLTTWVTQNDIPEGFPIERVSESDLQIIEEFLARRQDIPNHTQLAQHILASIMARLDIPQTAVHRDRAEEILGAIYRVLRLDK